LTREAELHIVEADAGQDRDAVPLAEPEGRDLVAGRLEGGPRELRIAALGLLERQDIGAGAFEPRERALLPGSDRVDVPGRQSHERHGTRPRGIESPTLRAWPSQ
jgi:hypothetical protein